LPASILMAPADGSGHARPQALRPGAGGAIRRPPPRTPRWH